MGLKSFNSKTPSNLRNKDTQVVFIALGIVLFLKKSSIMLKKSWPTFFHYFFLMKPRLKPSYHDSFVGSQLQTSYFMSSLEGKISNSSICFCDRQENPLPLSFKKVFSHVVYRFLKNLIVSIFMFLLSFKDLLPIFSLPINFFYLS